MTRTIPDACCGYVKAFPFHLLASSLIVWVVVDCQSGRALTPAMAKGSGVGDSLRVCISYLLPGVNLDRVIVSGHREGVKNLIISFSAYGASDRQPRHPFHISVALI